MLGIVPNPAGVDDGLQEPPASGTPTAATTKSAATDSVRQWPAKLSITEISCSTTKNFVPGVPLAGVRGSPRQLTCYGRIDFTLCARVSNVKARGDRR